MRDVDRCETEMRDVEKCETEMRNVERCETEMRDVERCETEMRDLPLAFAWSVPLPRTLVMIRNGEIGLPQKRIGKFLLKMGNTNLHIKQIKGVQKTSLLNVIILITSPLK